MSDNEIVNRGKAQSLLYGELAARRGEGYERLVRLIGQPSESRDLWLGSEPVTIETRVMWADSRRRAVRVEATVYGSSSYRLERVDEAMIVGPSDP